MNENKQTRALPYTSRIAGTIVLYNSERNVFENVKTYIDQIEKLYVVDNSDKPNPELIKQFNTLSTVQYVSNNGNQGVAYALNRAAELALADGFDCLLTMDDDTQLPSGSVTTMLHFLADYPAADKVGLISGVHSDNLLTDEPYRTVLYTMTSGNLLNLQAFRQVGPFRNDLFIDHVDHEYGLRLNKAGFMVLELPRLRINHRLGVRKSAFLAMEHLFLTRQCVPTTLCEMAGLLLLHMDVSSPHSDGTRLS